MELRRLDWKFRTFVNFFFFILNKKYHLLFMFMSHQAENFSLHINIIVIITLFLYTKRYFIMVNKVPAPHGCDKINSAYFRNSSEMATSLISARKNIEKSFCFVVTFTLLRDYFRILVVKIQIVSLKHPVDANIPNLIQFSTRYFPA